MKENIKTRKRLCVGCGLCASVCKKDCISFETDDVGHYSPIVNLDACVNCGVCLSNCPINGDNCPHPESLYYGKYVGGYHSSYIGYDPRFRSTSASGGLLTSYLYYLLVNHIVDTVICVKSQKSNRGYFEYAFIQNASELVETSRSAYYPLQLTNVVNYVRENNEAVAIVVLPCQAKGIRLLQRKEAVLKERIKILAGLVCGSMPGKEMIDYVQMTEHICDEEIEKVTFRDKDRSHFVSDYSLRFIDKAGGHKNSYLSGSFGFAFLNKLFVSPACNICNDVYAEYADIVFMDAWLDEYSSQIYGTSICIARTQFAENIARKCFLPLSEVRACEINMAIKAQQKVSVILRKKVENFVNRRIYKFLGYDVDVFPLVMPYGLIVKSYIKDTQILLIQWFSRKLWRKVKSEKLSIDDFNCKMKRLIHIIKMKR